MFISRKELEKIRKVLDILREEVIPDLSTMGRLARVHRYFMGTRQEKPIGTSRIEELRNKVNRMDTAIAVRQEHDIGFLKTIGELRLRLDGIGRGFDILKARMDRRKKNEVALFKRVAGLEKVYPTNLTIRLERLEKKVFHSSQTEESEAEHRLDQFEKNLDALAHRLAEIDEALARPVRKRPSAKRPARKR